MHGLDSRTVIDCVICCSKTTKRMMHGLDSRTVIDMTSIDRSKKKFQLIEKKIMSIVMSINRNTFFQLFTPFLANANKNFEEKLKQSESVEKTFIVFAL